MNTVHFEKLTDDLLRKLATPNRDPERAHALVNATLRQVWNARGAADIAKLEVELLSRKSSDPEGPLTRALRTLDR